MLPLTSPGWRPVALGFEGSVSPVPAAQTKSDAFEGARTFGELYAAHASFVWRSLRRLGVPLADAPDACQEAFVVVHRKLPGFDQRSTLRTWLFGICLRVASDWRRRAYLRREIPTPAPPAGESPPLQAEAIERAQARVLLDAILDRLDQDKRAIFALYELEGWLMDDVASAVGCPVQTAYSRLHAARRIVDTAIGRLQRQWSAA